MHFISAHQRSPWLAALIVWAAWAMSWLWTGDVLRRGELHPHPLPPMAFFFLFVVGVIALIVRVLWTMARRRRPQQALSALMIGTLPVWLSAAYLTYVERITAEHYVPIRALVPMQPMLSVLGELEARSRYARRTEGRRIVMFHQGLPQAEETTSAAEAYLARLERDLGRKGSTPLYWVRGYLFGRTAFSAGAFAVSVPRDGELLSELDRHELAHAAINQFTTWRSCPPTVLIEGWANAKSQNNPVAQVPVDQRDIEFLPTLSDLTAPGWAEVDFGPVYAQGAVFVDDLVRTFGGRKFLELYATCSPQTFDADCQRILGVGMTELARQHQQRLADFADGRKIRHLMNALPVAESVNRTAWRKFIEQYGETVDGEAASGDYETTFADATTGPITTQIKPPTRTYRCRALRWKDSRLLISDDEVLCVTSGSAFRLTRKRDERVWTAEASHSPVPMIERWQIETELAGNWPGRFRPEFESLRNGGWQGAPPSVTEFSEEGVAPNRIAHVTFRGGADPLMRPINEQLILSEAVGWRAVHQNEFYDSEKISRRSSIVDWKRANGQLVGMRRVNFIDSNPSIKYESETAIRVGQPFGVSEREFEIANYGIRSTLFFRWRLVPWSVTACLAIAFLQLVTGIGLVIRYGGKSSVGVEKSGTPTLPDRLGTRARLP